MKKNPYKALEKAIGYRFRKRARLALALTHRSYRFENADVEEDNQRLEFLGDAVLGFAVAAHAYETNENHDEGVMTSLRSQVTSGQALATIARTLELGEYLLMGKGEQQSGGRARSSNLADALEALLGAAYQDGDMKAVRKIFKKVFVPELAALSGDVWASNPKGKLQEISQRRWKKSPVYHLRKETGPAHAAVFTVDVELDDGISATGEGRSKQNAQREAARQALKMLGEG